jgi:hypothetical protein
MKSKAAMITPLVICHYEDEPGKVGLPELIEAGLYDSDDVSDSKIEWPPTRKRYSITYTYQDRPQSIIYLVEDSKKGMDEVLASIGKRKEILHIVDTSLGSDKSAGPKIVRSLAKAGVDCGRIWMLTAYAAEALRRTQEMKITIKIISKPPNFRDLRDSILQLIADETAVGS